jgi:ABC-type amino acid transport substrate-binding protein
MSRKFLKKIITVLTLAAITAGLTGCSSTDAGGGLQKVLDSGVLVLGLDVDYPPMGYRDESGEITGFDIDVAREVCSRMGVKLETKPIDWDEKEKELNNGAVDCIWNGMSVNKEREQAMALSRPYMKNELVFVVLGDSEFRSLDDMKGRSIGVQIGSTTVNAVVADPECADMKIVLANDNKELAEKLESGEIDAIAIDSILAYYYINETGKDYYILSEVLESEDIAIGFRKYDTDLRDKIQEILDEMSEDGTLAEISTKWFGADVTTVK